MNFFKKSVISCLYSFSSLFVLTFILTVFSYFDIVSAGWTIFFMIFNLVLSVFLGSFVMGKKSLKKGWLEGLKFGFIFLFLICLLNFFGFESQFSLKFIMFSIIILTSAFLGGMVGICFKKEK